MARLKYWIWLSCINGVRPLVKYQLTKALGGPEKLFFASKDEMLSSCGLIRPGEAERLTDKSMEEASKVIGRCEEKNISILTLQDADYPDRLRQIADPPVVLYIIGRLPAVDELPLIAVVGTRKATAYGLRMAAKMGRELTAGGGVVVSGLAAGCDGAAIQGALEVGGAPLGVLGTAVDQVYPRQNKWLFDELRTRGALISEYPPGMRTYPSDFVARNRIITGLSLGTVVVEAPIRSGTRTTVEHALEQNRDLFAVPGNADAAVCAGCNDLLAQGAMVATCGADVLRAYESRSELFSQAAAPTVLPIPIKKEIDKPEDIVYIDLTDEMEKLPTAQRDILKAMTRTDMHADEIIQETGIPAPEALAALTMLEITGYIVRSSGKRYTRKDRAGRK
ncbi:MAG: DNA-processing protein DprA [Oscillospiraceae bacterium]|nr:DNA-processing protein DprA [Oscillospiraceae bacterium]